MGGHGKCPGEPLVQVTGAPHTVLDWILALPLKRAWQLFLWKPVYLAISRNREKVNIEVMDDARNRGN